MGNFLNCGRTGQYNQAPVPGRFQTIHKTSCICFPSHSYNYEYSFSISEFCLFVCKRSEPYKMGRAY